ncbi:UNVERIFIED_CONTAM: hypothetical protein GTU68_047395 [Idotea baltica]|nr:hypothetical protein [Idotea baltica]
MISRRQLPRYSIAMLQALIRKRCV